MSSITAFEYFEIDIVGTLHRFGSRSVGNSVTLNSTVPDISHRIWSIANGAEVKVLSIGSTVTGASADDMLDFAYLLIKPTQNVTVAWSSVTDANNSTCKILANHWFKLSKSLLAAKTYSAVTATRVSENAASTDVDITQVWIGNDNATTATVEVIAVR